MILDLNKFYQYIFGDWADVDKHIKKELKDEVKASIKNKKIDEIRNFFFAAGAEGEALIKKNNRNLFHSVLRELKSTHLEQLLFKDPELCLISDQVKPGNLYLRQDGKHIVYSVVTPEGQLVSDIKLDEPLAPEPFTLIELNKLKQPILTKIAKAGHIYFEEETHEIQSSYKLPTDNEIEAFFKVQQNEYSYFSPPCTEALLGFKKFFKVCALVDRLVESNHTANGGIAANAYKLLAVFCHAPIFDFRLIDQYLKKFNFYKLNRPLHDALLPAIPKQEAKASFQLEAWQKLILNTGPQAFQLFSMAPAIEGYLKKPPANYSMALAAASNVKYKNSNQYPLLADLCFQYHRSEETFEKCLALEQKRKTQDNLPNISLDGKELNFPGYHIVKLPIHDPRAYLLGDVTNCCQSIGGDSEGCVIDGVTLANNGFYVLLKEKKEPYTSMPFNDQGIDYAKFDIVGQGYAWLSKQGNLVFDSWENLTPDRDDAIIVQMLKRYGQIITEIANSSIIRVTIGLGGKTPAGLRKNKFSESMLEGIQYGDSFVQSTLYLNKEKRQKLLSKLKNRLAQTFNQNELTEDENARLYSQLEAGCFSERFLEDLDSILLSKEGKLFLINHAKKPGVNKKIISPDIMLKLLRHNLLTSEICEYIQKINNMTDTIIDAALFLQQIAWGNDPVLRYKIFNELNSLKEIKKTYDSIKELKLDNDPKIREYYSKDLKIPHYVLNAYLILKNAGLVVTDGMMGVLYYQEPSIADSLANTIVKLAKYNCADDELLQSLFRTSLVRSRVKTVNEAFNKIDDLQLRDDFKIRKFILHNFSLKDGVIEAFAKLKEMKLDDMEEVREAIFKDAWDSDSTAGKIIKIFSMLKKNNQENNLTLKKLLFKNPDLYSAELLIKFYLKIHSGDNIDKSLEIDNILIKTYFVATLETFVTIYFTLEKVQLQNDKQIWAFVGSLYGRGLKNADFFAQLHTISTAMIKLAEFYLHHHPLIRSYLYENGLLDSGKINKILNAFTVLKASNIEIDDGLLKVILDNNEDAEAIARVLRDINELQLKDVSIIRKFILTNLSEKNNILEELRKVKELKLDDLPEIRQEIVALENVRSISALTKKREIFSILKKHYQENNATLKKLVFENISYLESIIDFYLNIHFGDHLDKPLEIDKIFPLVIKHDVALNSLSATFHKLREIKLENDKQLWTFVESRLKLFGPRYLYTAMSEQLGIMASTMISLAKYNLENDPQVRAYLYEKDPLLDGKSINKVLSAFATLKTANIEIDENIIKTILANKEGAEEAAQLIINQASKISLGIFGGVVSRLFPITAVPETDSKKKKSP